VQLLFAKSGERSSADKLAEQFPFFAPFLRSYIGSDVRQQYGRDSHDSIRCGKTRQSIEPPATLAA
jgi:hypothetical protein